MTHRKSRHAIVLALALITVPALTGCTPTEESETISGLQTALSDLTQNRSLTEQFVRDVKSSLDPGDPAYVQAMESYQDARDTYNRYLDTVESGQKRDSSRSLRGSSPRDVQNAAADFLADATRALKPTANTRKIAFQRAVIIPDNLSSNLASLPKKVRGRIVDNVDEQVRWRSWSQM